MSILQISILFWAIGRDLEGITVAIVNDEAGNCNDGRDLGHAIYNPINDSCQFINISCRFLDSFDYYIEKVSLIQYLINCKLAENLKTLRGQTRYQK